MNIKVVANNIGEIVYVETLDSKGKYIAIKNQYGKSLWQCGELIAVVSEIPINGNYERYYLKDKTNTPSLSKYINQFFGIEASEKKKLIKCGAIRII